VMFAFTVATLRCSRCAISALELPRATSIATSRSRLVSLAAVLASLFAVLAAVPLTAAVAAARDVPANWRVAPLALLGWTATNVLVAATGLAMGMLLLNAPAAIVVCLSSTMLWSAVGRWGAVGEFLAGWFDLNSAAGPLSAGELSGAGAARLATSALLWIVVPVAVGVLRTLRREVR
jgi:ABC-2 type transport system permease protein